MHAAGKIFLVLGVVVTIAGVLMMGGGLAQVDTSISNVESYELDVEENSEFSGTEGVSEYCLLYTSDAADE